MSRGSRFSDTYKREAVAKAETSGNVRQTARKLGISDKTLHSWKRKYGTPKSIDPKTASSAELAARVTELERQLAVKDGQIDILKKAISIVSQRDKNGSE